MDLMKKCEDCKEELLCGRLPQVVESSAQAVNLAAQLRGLLSRGGFWLLKWFSNRPEVMETISESERASSVLDLDLDKGSLPVERTWGLRWDVQKDMFIFDAALKSKLNTRRGILSLTSSIYDPLGFRVPIILSFSSFYLPS